MLTHRKNTRTKYEFAITNEAGEILFTIWTVKKSVTKAQRLCCEYVSDIEKATNTDGTAWTFTPQGIENKRAKMIGKHTGRTLLQARGY